MDKKITKLIEYAYNNVPYYNHVINNLMDQKSFINLNQLHFQDIPPHSKTDIKKWGWENFLSYTINEKDIIINKTSGTTGEPMDIIWSKKDYTKSLANHWYYRYKRFGVTPNDKCFTVERHKNNNNYSIIRNEKELVFNSNTITEVALNHIIEQIQKFRPKWFFCEASFLYVILKHALSNNINILNNVYGIEYKSEPLLSYYRDYLRIYTDSIPTINMYGCTETNGISYTCKLGIQHIMKYNAYVEILDSNGNNIMDDNFGNICVTSLHNTNMPFIRYKLDDIGRIRKNFKCDCGSITDIIELKRYRLPELLVFNDLEFCSEGIIIFPINRFLDYKKSQSHIFFKLYRISLDHYLVLFHNLHQNNIDEIKKKFLHIIDKYGIDSSIFEFTNSINIKGGIEGLLIV